jgi:hypothetical protein
MLQRIDWKTTAGVSEVHIPSIVRISSPRKSIVGTNLSVDMCNISKRKAKWIGQVLRRNCLLQRVIEGEIKGGIEVTVRRGRRRMKLLDDLKERRGYSHLEKEALDRIMWRAGFGRGFGPVVRQTTK